MLVRSMLFPRRTDVTPERMAAYISEWAQAGLVVWYEADGDHWLWFTGFDKNQTGLRKDREVPSVIPPPPARNDSGITPDRIRNDSGITPDRIRNDSRLSEEKRSEEKRSEEAARAHALTTAADGSDDDRNARFCELARQSGMVLSPLMVEQYRDILADVTDFSLVEDAFAEAARSDQRPTPRWLQAVLERCTRERCRPGQWRDKPRGRDSPRGNGAGREPRPLKRTIAQIPKGSLQDD
jgi:hypothetical protein